MKGRTATRWFCDLCGMSLVTYVRVSEPPTHVCISAEDNRTSTNRKPMKEKVGK